MRQHSSPLDCKDPLEGNQNYLCTTAPCKIKLGTSTSVVPQHSGQYETIKWRSNLSKEIQHILRTKFEWIKIWIGFYWSQLYISAVPLTSQEWTAINTLASTLVWVGSSMLKCITLAKAFGNTLLTVDDTEGEGGAPQAGVWLLFRQLSAVVWAKGAVETHQIMGP